MTKNKGSLHYVLLTYYCLLLGGFSAPEAFTKYLPLDDFVKGSAGMMVPPETIEPYVAKVEAAAKEDPAWFKEYSMKSTPGVPLPFDEKLGLTKEEYDAYRAEWDKRTFQEAQPVALRLEKSDDGNWMIRATGPGFPISSLRYDETKKELTSPNGVMTQIEDINADSDSILGAWSGQEWKHESETTISKTRENFGIGKLKDEPSGYLVYRLQEVSNTGRKLYDRRIIIKFPIAK